MIIKKKYLFIYIYFTISYINAQSNDYQGKVTDSMTNVGLDSAIVSFYDQDWKLAGKDTTDNQGNFGGTITSVDDDVLPLTYKLSQNYPNPFNDNTNFDVQTDKTQALTLTIYNILGEKVKEFSAKDYYAGNHKIHWNGRDGQGQEVATGVYFAVLSGKEGAHIKKMVYGLNSSSAGSGRLFKGDQTQLSGTYNLVTEKKGYKTDTSQVTLPNTNISIPLDEIIKSTFNFSVEDFTHADSLAEGLTTVQIGDSIFVSQNGFVSGRMPAGKYSMQVSNDSMHKVWKFEGNDGQWDRYFPDRLDPKVDLSHDLDGRIRMIDKDFDKKAWMVRWAGAPFDGHLGSAYWGPHPEKDVPVFTEVLDERGLPANEDSTTIKFYLWTQKNGNLPAPFNGYYAGDDFWNSDIVEFRPISDSEAQRVKEYFETTFNDFLDNKFNIEVIIGDEQNLPLKYVKNIAGIQHAYQKEGWHILQGGRYNAHYQSVNQSLDPENRIFSARTIMNVFEDGTVSPTGYVIEAAQSQGVLFDGAGDPYPIQNANGQDMTGYNDFGMDGQRINLNMGRAFRFFDE